MNTHDNIIMIDDGGTGRHQLMQKVHLAFGQVRLKKKTVGRIIHTLNDPLIKDTRFLHTGSRISIQFRLRAAALALAQAKAG